MATPLGHSLAGYAVSSFFGAARSRDRFILVLLGIIMTNVLDLDFLSSILLGKPAFYHQRITHSLGFAMLVSLGIASISRMRRKSFFLCFICAS